MSTLSNVTNKILNATTPNLPGMMKREKTGTSKISPTEDNSQAFKLLEVGELKKLEQLFKKGVNPNLTNDEGLTLQRYNATLFGPEEGALINNAKFLDQLGATDRGVGNQAAYEANAMGYHDLSAYLK